MSHLIRSILFTIYCKGRTPACAHGGPGPRDAGSPGPAPWVGGVRPREPRPGPHRRAVASPRWGVLSGPWRPVPCSAPTVRPGPASGVGIPAVASTFTSRMRKHHPGGASGMLGPSLCNADV